MVMRLASWGIMNRKICRDFGISNHSIVQLFQVKPIFSTFKQSFFTNKVLLV